MQKMKFEEKNARQKQIELHLGQFVYEQEGSSDQWSFKEEDRCAVQLKHCQRHNGPRILSPKLELSLKAETNANSNLAL